MKTPPEHHSTLRTVLLIITVVIFTAITGNFHGVIVVNVRVDGVQIKIDGRSQSLQQTKSNRRAC